MVVEVHVRFLLFQVMMDNMNFMVTRGI